MLVIGCGALGQFALQLLRLVPDDGRDLFVVVRELSPARLERAAELGADVGLLDGEPDMSLEALGRPADVVLDFVGTDSTLAHAAAVVAPDGLVVLVGEAGGSLPFGFDARPGGVVAHHGRVGLARRPARGRPTRCAARSHLRWDGRADVPAGRDGRPPGATSGCGRHDVDGRLRRSSIEP